MKRMRSWKICDEVKDDERNDASRLDNCKEYYHDNKAMEGWIEDGKIHITCRGWMSASKRIQNASQQFYSVSNLAIPT